MNMGIKKSLLLICLLSILPLSASLFSSDLVHTHDGLVHLPRIAAFYKALLDGQFPVRWAGDLNYGYGMPLFIFIYHIPYLFSSVFLLLGLGLVWSFKLSLLLSFLLSGMGMLLFAQAFFKDQKKAILITLLYQFAPFHLIDLTIRASFGEIYTYAFLPFVLYFLTRYSLTKNAGYLALSSVAVSLLILSHNSISLLFFGVSVLFVFFFSRTKKILVYSLFSLALGLMLSSFYWIPALMEHKYTYGDLFMKDLYRDRFPPLWKFFLPNFFDTKSLQIDNIALQIGVFHLGAVLLGIWLLIRKLKEKIEKRIILFSVLLLVSSFFFMSDLSLVAWENISFLRQFQFPWRFLSVVVFASSLLGFTYLKFLRKNVYFFLVSFLIILSSMTYWFPKEGYDHIKESYYWNFPLNSTYYGETDVIWSAGPAKAYPEKRISVIEGRGEVGKLQKRSNYQEVSVRAVTDLKLVSNTQYFPGWRVYVDGISVPIQFQNEHYRGLITFSVPKGDHIVEIKLEESKLRLVADSVSVVGALLLLLAVFFRKKIL